MSITYFRFKTVENVCTFAHVPSAELICFDESLVDSIGLVAWLLISLLLDPVDGGSLPPTPP
jgi:hypothetical protein